MSADGYFRWSRAIWRFVLLIGTSLQAAFEFAAQRLHGPPTLPRRAEWLHRSCAKALTRLGITLDVDGPFPSRGLLVCNHLSYIDVLALSAIAPCVFVAKRQVRSWPLFGRLARFGATIFVDRDRPSDTTRASTQLGQALAVGVIVVLFPEGTSSNGSTVLPFRPALFKPAVQLNHPISTAHISYAVEGGSVEQDVCYWGGMVFLPHLLRFMRLRNVTARVRLGREAIVFEDRKMAAVATRQQILGLACSWNPPKETAVDTCV
jgi:1-acyl-sn-glycerol-3-phosphate acyltransferase